MLLRQARNELMNQHNKKEEFNTDEHVNIEHYLKQQNPKIGIKPKSSAEKNLVRKDNFVMPEPVRSKADFLREQK